jgi:ribosomal protein L31
MKADIHPEYPAVAVTCSCGNKFETRSTFGKALRSTFATNATRSTPVSRRLWTLAAAFSASQTVSVLSVRKRPKADHHGKTLQFSHADEKGVPRDAFFVCAQHGRNLVGESPAVS